MRSWLEILCAVDLGEGSRVTLEDAADLARRLGARLTLLHVREPSRAAAGRALAVVPEAAEQEAVEIGRKLDRWRAEAERIAGTPVRAIAGKGPPGAEIVRIAGDERADLLVVGTHARRGLGRLVLGSIAEQVVRNAPCPVLVSRPAPDPGD